METLEKKVQKSIGEFSDRLVDSENVKNFKRAIEKFQSLIKSGVITPRGNHLLSISDGHLTNQVSFNTTLEE